MKNKLLNKASKITNELISLKKECIENNIDDNIIERLNLIIMKMERTEEELIF